MTPKEQIEALKKAGRSKKSVAGELGMSPENLSKILSSEIRQFSKLQEKAIAQIYEREISKG